MITKLTLRNFKSIREQTYELSGFDLLVGPNNSGKSTVLQALAIWQFCVDEFRRASSAKIPVRWYRAQTRWFRKRLGTGDIRQKHLEALVLIPSSVVTQIYDRHAQLILELRKQRSCHDTRQTTERRRIHNQRSALPGEMDRPAKCDQGLTRHIEGNVTTARRHDIRYRRFMPVGQNRTGGPMKSRFFRPQVTKSQ